MPSSVEIQQYLSGVWRMMTGRPDGMRLLDISVDGFWNSFFAILVALPVMLASWVPLANELAEAGSGLATRLSFVMRLAIVDLGAWLLPIAGLVLAARYIGIRDRLVHYVVASNWGSALLIWFMAPPTLIGLFWPDGSDAVSFLAFVIFMITMVLSWRLTNVSLAKGPAVASAVFAAMLFASFIILLGLQDLLGLIGQ